MRKEPNEPVGNRLREENKTLTNRAFSLDTYICTRRARNALPHFKFFPSIGPSAPHVSPSYPFFPSLGGFR